MGKANNLKTLLDKYNQYKETILEHEKYNIKIGKRKEPISLKSISFNDQLIISDIGKELDSNNVSDNGKIFLENLLNELINIEPFTKQPAVLLEHIRNNAEKISPDKLGLFYKDVAKYLGDKIKTYYSNAKITFGNIDEDKLVTKKSEGFNERLESEKITYKDAHWIGLCEFGYYDYTPRIAEIVKKHSGNKKDDEREPSSKEVKKANDELGNL